MNTVRLLAFALICAQTSFAQTAVTPDRIGEVDSFLTALHNGGKFNGGLLIAEKGKVIYYKYFGYANIPGKIPFTDSSTFSVASVSKTFTAIAVLQLMEKKKLSLDDPFVNYFPDFPYPTVRIRQMLNHTSGIPTEPDFFASITKKYPDSVLLNKDVIPVLKAHGKPLVFPPGDRYLYCNTNYELLALLVEKISHQPFSDYLRQHIFRPAHMEHTYVRRVDILQRDDYAVVNHVFPHEYSMEYGNVDTLKKGHIRNANIIYGGTFGDNNVITTPGDLLRYDRALYGEKLLGASTLKLAFAPTLLNNGKMGQFYKDSTLLHTSYGLGWVTSVDSGSDKVVSHGGNNFGASTMFYRNITRDRTIILCDNIGSEEHYKTMAIANFLDGKPLRKEWAFAFDLKKSIARVYGHDLVEEGADAAFIHLCALRQDSLHYYLNRRQVTLMGYDLLENGFKEAGLESFRVNTLLFPEDMGAYGNYGLALSDNGKKEEAIAVYRVALAQDPNDKNIKEFLDRELSEKRVRDSVVAKKEQGGR